MTSVSELSNALIRRVHAADGRVVVVALDGPSGAGKTTLASHLAAQLPSATLHMDDFYRDEPDATRLLHDAQAGVLRYFDWERLRDEALEPMRRGKRAVFRPFDWDHGSGLCARVELEPAPVVLVEGVYSARPELRHLVDVTALVTASESERRRRLSLRHDPHEWMPRWDAAERLYFAGLDGCDFVVDCE